MTENWDIPGGSVNVPVPAPVDELHGLHGERRGHNVIGAVPTSSHCHQPVYFSRYKDEARRADEAQQARPGEGKLADRSAAARNGKHLQQREKRPIKKAQKR